MLFLLKSDSYDLTGLPIPGSKLFGKLSLSVKSKVYIECKLGYKTKFRTSTEFVKQMCQWRLDTEQNGLILDVR